MRTVCANWVKQAVFSRLLVSAYVLLGVAACNAVESELLLPAVPDGGDFAAAQDTDAGVFGGDGDRGGDAGSPAAPPPAEPLECEHNPDAEQPPSCSRPRAESACFEGSCFVVSCLDDYRDCNQEQQDGCEASPQDPEHCGGCNQACTRPGALFECAKGECIYLGCADGFADCDMDASNGCEVDITGTANCGACDRVCPTPPMGAPACIAGSCGVGECMIGFGDCDGDPMTGCEQPLDTDGHCGGCGQACSLPAATGRCETDTCVVDTCVEGKVDCNGIGADGCETGVDSPDNCGGCGIACDLPGSETHGCNAGMCFVDHSCPQGQGGCTPDAAQSGCDDGYADCDGDPTNGCEAFLGDVEHCGSCDDSCIIPNSIPACIDRQCAVVGCEPGYDQCVEGGPCISLFGDDDNCGGCGDACENGSTCAGGVCTLANCAVGTADCDAELDNECETNLLLPDNCGGCGITCGPYDHATARCEGGLCVIDACDDGYADCDAVVGNGCEVDVTLLADCGSCGSDCGQLPGVLEVQCVAGVCEIAQCEAPQADCDGAAPGCETNIAQPGSCGSCGNDCSVLPNTRSVGCNDGTCEFSCESGYADCNAMPGCETDLMALTTCGACDNDCSALSSVAAAECIDGACANITCTEGFEDCDELVFTGCEQGVTDTQNCGGCSILCAPPGASSSSCPGGSCEFSCDGTLKDCNGQPADGCETDTSSDNDHCGGCGTICLGVCNDGVCSCEDDLQCGAGEACCAGTCADLTARDNCNGCGNWCYPWQFCTSGCCRSSPFSPCGT